MKRLSLGLVLLRFSGYFWLTCGVTTARHKADDQDGIHSQLILDSDSQRPLFSTVPDHASLQDGVLPIAGDFDPLKELRHALNVMQSEWFDIPTGNWPEGIDWTRATVDTFLVSSLSTLSKALHVSKSDAFIQDAKAMENEINQYFTQNIAYYFGENAFSLRNQAYDDMLWVVLGWLESIKFIRTHSGLHYEPMDGIADVEEKQKPWHGSQFITTFAHRARIFYEIASRGWDTDLCNGGMVWNPRLGPYKNAITNELFIAASIGMYLHFPGDNNRSPFVQTGEAGVEFNPVQPHDRRFMLAAVEGYDWLKNSNMTNDQGLYVDGYHVRNWKGGGTTCNLRNEMVYSYNQGVLLSGLRGLFESTGNRSYLDDGHSLLRNVVKATGWMSDTSELTSWSKWAGLGRGGILEDFCDASGRCNQDGQTFKGIFIHHLTLFCEPLPCHSKALGRSYSADVKLALEHHESCMEYGVWVRHNAKAALKARDEGGRFGNWWSADGDAKATPLPAGAFDYRNEPFRHHDQDRSHGKLSSGQDLNDRGRGRTVETHGGGVAVLRALWELENAI